MISNIYVHISTNMSATNMFQATVSPKLLNVEKLEKKFASLTRSRESIQGLSTWIIRHKDFYKEIVNQWLQALTKDFNALTMFYVANDVIQNCGRKKAPEFREAFASVLEKAVSLQKVKDIKTEVTRMLTLWHDRAIYDDDFFKKLEDKLNAAVDESESEKEEELSETEVIANFKLENVINSLEKLKTLEEELHEKETFLEDIEEPGMCNIDNLIVKMDSQKELRKFDKFQKLVEDCIALTEKVLAAKKVALLNLKYSSIFYSAQMEDAKKVAHAYRIYGKKVKMLEKSLFEKMATLPEQTFSSPQSSDLSPCVELTSSQESLSTTLVCTETDKSSGCQENNSEACFHSERTENELKGNAVDKKGKNIADETSPSANNTIIVEELEKNVQEDSEKTQKPSSSIEDVTKDNAPELNESFSKIEDSLTKKTSDSGFQALPDTESIDFLLEKAYDDQVKGSKLSFKRKIDNLLKLKQAKSCKLSSDEDSIHNKMPSDNKMSLECQSLNKIPSQSVSSDCQTLAFHSSMENNSDTSVSPVSKEENIVNTKNTNETGKVCLTSSAISVESKNVAEKIIKTPDVPLNTSNTEKVNNSCVSEKSKDDHSTEVKPDIQVSNNDELKTISSSNSYAFQSLPDIPTELLKNILNKHRINMNLSSNSDTPTSKASAQCFATKHSEQTYSSQNEDAKDMNLNHSLMTKVTEKSLKSINSGVAGTCPDGDNIFSSNVKDSDSEKKNPEIKSTVFLENLQNVLEHFTKKETSFKDIKCSETMSIPLENTLKVFNCIMQNCNEVDCITKEPFISSNYSNNSVSDIPTKEFLNNKRFCSAENEINHVSQGVSLTKQESSGFCNEEDEFEKFSINSKNDNLEIIDMEVDSDDEN